VFVRKPLFILLFLLLTGNLIFGQQLPMYSQYLYNKILINPSVAGNDGYTSLSLTAREQWVGYYGAPRTFSFSLSSRVLKKSHAERSNQVKRNLNRPSTDGKVGYGLNVFSDKNGLITRTGFQADYAYHIWLQKGTQLSMGLALTGYLYKINDREISFEDQNEPWMNNDLRRGMFVPDATVGISVLNAKYSFGFSSDQLLGAAAKIGNEAYDKFKMSRQYYLYGSYDFSMNKNVTIQPTFLMMTSEQLKPVADVGATYIYNEDFWVGLAFRTSGALVANVGVRYENIFIGYAYDYSMSQIQQVTYGTHEITFALKFGDNRRRYRWLDRY
jgi:type IX secretion system PorP/SprF family membrane protein